MKTPFRFLIVVDFETTCFREGFQAFREELDKREIIEFPAVLLNLETGNIEKGFLSSFIVFEQD
jgi:inhibitor of KinA sporulation pathway (predicted exonuclease)